ncbi:outer membrane lipoprotein-sorting protein [Selenihalanaerobacter shriftii]|uniref:Sigma E regulatory protein, MucB/RseB n=1 Tax=Selenihalanaerobacter shriftii TaxID=142842 RepID=A0A1T4JU30_9FIRM|nr:outer membrane lipoprotein-sorting protein [Selenihalanaerobacter shriftii]SJZ33615.1 sigma E regulatory protein, MucB/RseB [Selenihalanaerobacter shriftii]
MKKITVGLVLILVLSMSMNVLAMNGKEVMQKVDDRATGDSMHALMGMDLIEKDGEVKRRVIEVWGEIYNQEKDLMKTVMEFKAPAAVKGTRFLQIENANRDDDKWIYLPALGRVRRISSSEGDSSFMGSDFTYDDMETREVAEDDHKLLRTEKLGKYECYVVKSVPKDMEASQYAKRISWITKKHSIPVKIEMYSKQTGEVQKLLKVKQNIKKVNGIWTIFSTIMEDKETGHSTRLYIKRNKSGNPYIEYNKRISSARFTQRFLKTGR